MVEASSIVSGGTSTHPSWQAYFTPPFQPGLRTLLAWPFRQRKLSYLSFNMLNSSIFAYFIFKIFLMYLYSTSTIWQLPVWSHHGRIEQISLAYAFRQKNLCYLSLSWTIVDRINWLWSSKNFKRCVQSCFVLRWTICDRANCFDQCLAMC